jgi:hypothetical protein
MSGMESLGDLVDDLAAAAPLRLVNPYACHDPDLVLQRQLLTS